MAAAQGLDGKDWRDLVQPARMAARRLVVAGKVKITQAGRVGDPSTVKVPIRSAASVRCRPGEVPPR